MQTFRVNKVFSPKQGLIFMKIISRKELLKLAFNCVGVLHYNTSTLVGHFVSSPREREKKDRKDSRGDEREGQGRKTSRNESEETSEIETFPLYPYLLQR